jgi:hypothetical protein
MAKGFDGGLNAMVHATSDLVSLTFVGYEIL